jgi:hypothetical protein
MSIYLLVTATAVEDGGSCPNYRWSLAVFYFIVSCFKVSHGLFALFRVSVRQLRRCMPPPPCLPTCAARPESSRFFDLNFYLQRAGSRARSSEAGSRKQQVEASAPPPASSSRAARLAAGLGAPRLFKHRHSHVWNTAAEAEWDGCLPELVARLADAAVSCAVLWHSRSNLPAVSCH